MTAQQKLGSNTHIFDSTKNSKSYLDGGHARRTSDRNAFATSTNMFSSEREFRPVQPQKADGISWMSSAKKPSNYKIQELTGSNPIAHDTYNQVNMIKEGRQKSVAGCYGSQGMNESLQSELRGIRPLQEPKNIAGFAY